MATYSLPQIKAPEPGIIKEQFSRSTDDAIGALFLAILLIVLVFTAKHNGLGKKNVTGHLANHEVPATCKVTVRWYQVALPGSAAIFINYVILAFDPETFHALTFFTNCFPLCFMMIDYIINSYSFQQTMFFWYFPVAFVYYIFNIIQYASGWYAACTCADGLDENEEPRLKYADKDHEDYIFGCRLQNAKELDYYANVRSNTYPTQSMCNYRYTQLNWANVSGGSFLIGIIGMFLFPLVLVLLWSYHLYRERFDEETRAGKTNAQARKLWWFSVKESINEAITPEWEEFGDFQDAFGAIWVEYRIFLFFSSTFLFFWSLYDGWILGPGFFHWFSLFQNWIVFCVMMYFFNAWICVDAAQKAITFDERHEEADYEKLKDARREEKEAAAKAEEDRAQQEAAYKAHMDMVAAQLEAAKAAGFNTVEEMAEAQRKQQEEMVRQQEAAALAEAQRLQAEEDAKFAAQQAAAPEAPPPDVPVDVPADAPPAEGGEAPPAEAAPPAEGEQAPLPGAVPEP